MSKEGKEIKEGDICLLMGLNQSSVGGYRLYKWAQDGTLWKKKEKKKNKIAHEEIY